MSYIQRVGLAEVLSQLRSELNEAQLQGKDDRLRFQVVEADLELVIEISKEVAPGAKVKIEVVGLGGLEGGVEGTRAMIRSHRVALKLAIVDRETQRNVEVADSTDRPWNR